MENLPLEVTVANKMLWSACSTGNIGQIIKKQPLNHKNTQQLGHPEMFEKALEALVKENS